MNKSELRKIFIAKRKEISPSERNEKSRAIFDHIFDYFDFTKMNFVHCFLPIERFKEIDTHLLFHDVWQRFPNIQTVVPRVDFENVEMESVVYDAETELRENDWNIREPVHNIFVEAEKIDAVFVPLLCADERGFRVGYGKGFYDRFLKDCREDCLKIGLDYAAPIEEISDVNEFDIKLDFLVTSEKVYGF
ncbi:MAG TPA: 5-formyltetrahydrofolate cyclo-ligase [Pyrinomonadaceae bacterium]|nr:5-formyltetrahydrofolate cyclo-ligase [Pyrinomonadaceae bacterium]